MAQAIRAGALDSVLKERYGIRKQSPFPIESARKFVRNIIENDLNFLKKGIKHGDVVAGRDDSNDLNHVADESGIAIHGRDQHGGDERP